MKFAATFALVLAFALLAGCAAPPGQPGVQPTARPTATPTGQPLVGNDSDAHGCKPSAGYSWCEEKQKCLRTWEEPCQATPTPQIVGGDKDAHGCIGSAGYSWCEEKQKCLRIWEENCTSSIGQEARLFCGRENVAHAATCGSFVKVISSLLGGGSTYYRNGDVAATCPVVGPGSETPECARMRQECEGSEEPVC